MPSVPSARRFWCIILAAIATASSVGCDRFQDTPLEESPPGEQPPPPGEQPPATPKDDLVSGYEAAIASLPDFSVEQGSSWSGLTLGSSGVGTRRSETSRSVEEIAAELEALQETVKAIRLLSERETAFPDCAAPQDAASGDGIPACRVARDAARLLHSDAIRLFARGETEDAAHRIAAGLGIVRQLAQADEVASTNALAILTLIAIPCDRWSRASKAGSSMRSTGASSAMRSIG